MPESIKSDIRKGYRMASEQAEEKGPANRNSRAESKQGSRRKRRALLIVIPLLLARAAAAGLAVAYRSGMRQHNGPQGTQTSRIARGSHSARGDNSNSSASPGTEGQEGSDAGSSGRVNSSAKGTGSDAGGDNSIEDFPGTDVYKPYILQTVPARRRMLNAGRVPAVIVIPAVTAARITAISLIRAMAAGLITGLQAAAATEASVWQLR